MVITVAEKKQPKRYRATMRYNGKKYEATGKNQREADRKLAEKIATVKRGEETHGGNQTVAKWYDTWMETYKVPSGVSAPTLARYRSMYNIHIGPYIGSKRMIDVSPIDLQQCLNQCGGMSDTLISVVRSILKDVFHRARAARLIPVDPAEDLVAPRGYTNSRRSLTDLERRQVLETAETHKYGLWVLTMLYTGMRPGETAALTWSNVDFERSEIHVVAARETGTKNSKGPKTESGKRDIPMIPELKRRLLAEHDRLQPGPFDLVFPSRLGGIVSRNPMLNRWKSFRTAAGLSDDVTAYHLRHTFATDLQRAGVPINVARDLLGHSDISMTAKVYTHRDGDTLHRSMQLYSDLQAAIGGNG